MKKILIMAGGLMAGVALTLAAAPAMAGGVDFSVNVGVPGNYQAPGYVQQQPYYVQERPVYIEQEREQDWRERQVRARHWQERQSEGRQSNEIRNRDDRQEQHSGQDRGEHRNQRD